jgi:PTHB1 C-terminus
VPANIFFFADLRAHEEQSFVTDIHLSESEVCEIFSSVLTIMVSFINKQSIARVLRHSVDIPLKNIVQKTQPLKDGIFKITLSAPSPIVELSEIFSGKYDDTLTLKKKS